MELKCGVVYINKRDSRVFLSLGQGKRQLYTGNQLVSFKDVDVYLQLSKAWLKDNAELYYPDIQRKYMIDIVKTRLLGKNDYVNLIVKPRDYANLEELGITLTPQEVEKVLLLQEETFGKVVQYKTEDLVQGSIVFVGHGKEMYYYGGKLESGELCWASMRYSVILDNGLVIWASNKNTVYEDIAVTKRKKQGIYQPNQIGVMDFRGKGLLLPKYVKEELVDRWGDSPFSDIG